jgi:phosphohistidine phosphatase
MELILWRHAEAEIGEPDLGRKLTPRGEKQARRVAEWLHAQLPDSARILVSPATRAQQTAKALAEVTHR